MQINLIKQPLIPAFLSLVLLTVVALCHTQEGVAVADARYGFTAEELPIAQLGALITQFQAAHPTWSRWIAGLLMLFTGVTLGRLGVRYNLYGTGTCITIPLYALTMMGCMGSGEYLLAVVVSSLATLSVKNCCMSYRNGFGFDRIFRGALFLALLILVVPVAVPLLLMLPLAIVYFRRTVREGVVALGGLLLPIALVCYLNWAQGGLFTAPAVVLYRAFMAGDWLQAPLHATPVEQLFVGVLVGCSLIAAALFRINSYSVSTKARHILRFTCRTLLCVLLLFLLPSVSATHLGILAVPTTLLLPVLFVRIHRSIAQPLYVALVLGAIAALLVR